MNKARISACAALIAGLFILNAPLNAAVESPIVGYTTVTMEAGKWYQVGYPFVQLDDATSSAKVPLNKVFTEGFSNGDYLLILDPTLSRYGDRIYWVEGKGWCTLPNAAGKLVDTELEPGQAVYIYKSKAGAVTFSGKVEAQVVEFGQDEGSVWEQVAPVWPAKVALNGENGLKWDNLSTGDYMMILNSNDKKYGDRIYWVEGKGWCTLPNAAGKLVDTELEPGQAVYIYKKTPGIATVTK